ncbi:ribonuclease HII [Rivularia sp. UHCC 0363]|uniref:ribonuclease HII n=1 Tax=Rivularia sp. UHCC 0363 TaxID=3110244 RepID=UPI002B1FA44A|nr:ribonuclease HII [Rivularia sp. UHCC 0363]MEA5593924.1 ribonuclease HII [Rivularia sp. UHCC 0363]
MVEIRQVIAPIDKRTLPFEQNWLEFSTYRNTKGPIVGVDEVGRGALFGPVVAAAVILPDINSLPELFTTKIKDSKKLSASRRNQLANSIFDIAIDWKVGFATTVEIDSFNILQASLLAMKRAVLKLKVQPALCLIDGNQPIKDLLLPQETIVKGDSRLLTIASASIVAKVWRDQLIIRLAQKYPMYDLVRNKGYGSQKHLLALQNYGSSRLHRKSFRPCQIGQKLNRE